MTSKTTKHGKTAYKADATDSATTRSTASSTARKYSVIKTSARWASDEVAVLKSCLSQKHAYDLFASKYPHRTRSSVRGMIHRLGLTFK